MKNTLTTVLLATLIALPAAALAACGDDESDSGGSAAAGQKSGDTGDDKQSGDAPSRDTKVLASKTAKGDFPAILASATVEDPGVLKVRATPTPATSTAVSWTVACRKGQKAGTTDGKFTVTAPATKTLRKPLRRSDSCNVSASAQMTAKGSIKLEVIG